jgi:hypothetical protein
VIGTPPLQLPHEPTQATEVPNVTHSRLSLFVPLCTVIM